LRSPKDLLVDKTNFHICNFNYKLYISISVKGAYNILVGKPEGRRPLGRPRRRWEDNIKMDLWEIEFVDVD
jgi:hypothetical protein